MDKNGFMSPPLHIRVHIILLCTRECVYLCSRRAYLFLSLDEREGDSLTSVSAIIVGGELLDWLCHVWKKNEQELEKRHSHLNLLSTHMQF